MRQALMAACAGLLCLFAGGCATTSGGVRRLDGSRLSRVQADRAVLRLMTVGRIPGLALAFVNDGRIVYEKAYGLRNVAEKQPLTTVTVMYGASLTKAAFAYLVMNWCRRT
jgi:CubicO group peptidase (beta-lactamase class C family)